MKFLGSTTVAATAAILSYAVSVNAQSHGEAGAQEMGPVAFLWPPDREWNDNYDNTAPCGSLSGIVNRTEFPLTDGAVALVMQDSAWDLNVSIYIGNSDPRSLSDFSRILPEVSSLEKGHVCYYLPDEDLRSGVNATFEIAYTAVDDGVNATQYACADVTFVSESEFNYTIPCFNVSLSDYSGSNESWTSASDTLESTTLVSVVSSTAEATLTSTLSSVVSSTAAAATSSAAAAANTIAGIGFLGPILLGLAAFA
ncbi:hypothetical protein V1511DRAFT_512259 [Dipodascopsis uninucleata]